MMKIIIKTLLLFLFWFSALHFCNAEIPTAGSPEWVKIVLDGTANESGYDEVMDEHNTICGQIRDSIRVRGFMSVSDGKKACKFFCTDIVAERNCVSDVKKTKAVAMGTRIMEWSAGDDEFVLDDETLEVWWIIFWRLWPLLLSIIPVVMSQAKVYKWAEACGLLVVYIIVMMFVATTSIQKVYLFVTAFACLMATGSNGVMPEVVGGLMSLVFFVCIAFLTGLVTQIVTSIIIVMIYVAWLVRAFGVRRSGAVPGVLITFCTILVLIEQINILRTSHHLCSFNMDILQMLANSAFPYGDSWSYCKNAMRLSKSTINHLAILAPWTKEYQFQLFAIFSVCQIGLSFLFRAFLGMFVITKMRYKFEFDNVTKGFVVYMSDLFGGVSTVISAIFMVEEFELRKIAYAVINILFLTTELMFGFDIVVFRFIIFFCDAFIFRTCFCWMPKYLRLNLNRSDFPQEGALVWMSLRMIDSLKKHIVRVMCIDEDGNRSSGMGFLRRVGKKVMLVSVSHIVKANRAIEFRDRTYSNPVCYYATDTTDPVGFVDVSPVHDGAEVPFLDFQEIGSVKELFALKMDADGEIEITRVTNFKFDEYGSIKAAIDLSRGDSGSPVFAAMLNGSIRYAGAVSSGDPNTFNGNYISSIVRHDSCRSDSFDSDSDADSCDGTRIVNCSTICPRDELAAYVESTKRQAQSVYDLLGKYVYVDPSDEGNEVRIFDSESDCFDHMNQNFDGDMDVKVPSDDPGKGRKRGRKKSDRTQKQLTVDIKHRLNKVWKLALDFLTDEDAIIYMRELRFGLFPKITIEHGFVSFPCKIKENAPMRKLDYYAI